MQLVRRWFIPGYVSVIAAGALVVFGRLGCLVHCHAVK